MKKWLPLLLQTLVSVALLGWIFWRPEFRSQVWLAAKGHNRTAALLSVLMDRMSGLGALVLCSLTFMLWRLDWLMSSPMVAGVIKFVFGYLIVVIVLVAFSFLISARGLTSRLPERLPGRKMILEFTGAYMQFVASWRATLVASALSLVILLAYFATFYCSARAFGVNIPVLDFFAFMPAVDIISALPVSLGGFGVRDKLFAVLLGELSGVSMAQAVSVSLGGAVLSLAWGLFGLALLPSYRQAVKS